MVTVQIWSGSDLTTFITCPGCTHKLALPDGVVGERVKCPRCQTDFEAQPEATLALDSYSAKIGPSRASARTMFCIECGSRFAPPGKFCPGCGLSVETMMHGQAPRPRWRVLTPLFETLPIYCAILVPAGVIFFIGAIVMDDMFRFRRPPDNLDTLLIAGGFLLAVGFELAALICGMVWFYQAWRLMARDDEEFSAGLKTGLLFVPGFNLYWMFVVIPGLSAAIQGELREIAPNRSHNTGWVPGLVGCVLLVIPYLQPIAVCMLIGWMVLANSSLQRLIRYHERLRDEEDGVDASEMQRQRDQG